MDEAITKAAAKFPAEFGLYAYPGKTFRVDLGSSYMSQGQVVLYTEIKMPDGTWLDFAKGTPDELAAEVTTL